MTHTRTWAIALFWLGILAAPAESQNPRPSPTFPGESLVGRDSFDAYCASCHGPGGRGDGPVAPALKAVPADLTALSSRNDGVFPRAGVRAVLAGTGRTVSAHGTTEMPIWGPLFRMFESDARARVRIDNLVTYIESLQTRSRD